MIFGQTRFFVRYCCCCFVNSLKTILGISSACVVYDERVLLMLLFSFRFYGVRSDIGVLGFFPLICIHAIEFRYRRTDGRQGRTLAIRFQFYKNGTIGHVPLKVIDSMSAGVFFRCFFNF